MHSGQPISLIGGPLCILYRPVNLEVHVLGLEEAIHQQGPGPALPPRGANRKCMGCQEAVNAAAEMTPHEKRARRNEFYRVKTQCQACGDAVCKDHVQQLCRKYC